MTINLPRWPGATDRTGTALWFALSAILLGHTLQMSNGHQDDGAMKVLTAAIAAALVGVAMPAIPALRRWGDRPLLALLGLGLVWQFGQLMSTLPAIYRHFRSLATMMPFFIGVSAAAVLSGMGLAERPLLERARMPLLLLIHFALGVWLIKVSPSPIIDVDTMQRQSVEALAKGLNPYTLTFPNPYTDARFFGEKLVKDGRILLGFPYPPLSLLLAMPGQLLLGDYRYGQLVAITGAGALMAYSRPGRVAPAAAALFLFTPRVFFVLEQGWTDPFLVLMLALTAFAALRRPRWVPWVFGLFLALKQYSVFALLLIWLLPPRPWRWSEFGRSALKAGALALIITLPLALWNLQAFMNDLILNQLGVPFRPDALTFLAWRGTPPDQRVSMLSLAALGVTVVLAAVRSPRTAAGFAGAMAVLYFLYFSLGSHAFCNQYFFVLGALCCAVATSEPAEAALAAPLARGPD